MAQHGQRIMHIQPGWRIDNNCNDCDSDSKDNACRYSDMDGYRKCGKGVGTFSGSFSGRDCTNMSVNGGYLAGIVENRICFFPDNMPFHFSLAVHYVSR